MSTSHSPSLPMVTYKGIDLMMYSRTVLRGVGGTELMLMPREELEGINRQLVLYLENAE